MERSFERDFRALGAVFGFTERLAAAQGLSRSLKNTIDLIVEELFTNMVKHNTGGGRPIRIRMEIEGKRLKIDMVDEDVDPWDPSREPQMDLGQLVRGSKSGGLGLRLVRAITDELTYDYKDRQMTVTVIKSLEQ